VARIAFIGLGNMGLGMARRLLQAGHDLRVFNRTRSKATELERAGAAVFPTPREAAAGAEAVIGMTADDSSSRSVWLGPEGLLAAELAPRALAVECATLSHEWVMQLAAAARARNLRYIDAPVTGVPESAAAGTLTLLVGADLVDLNRAQPILSAFSERILRFGPVGSGTAYKLIINLIGAVQIASLAEGYALAERSGLDPAVVLEAISIGQAASPQVVRNAQRMTANDHDTNIVFTPVLRLKDVEYALRLAGTIGLAAPFGELAGHQFRKLIELGHGRANESRVVDIARGKNIS
jgi:3-hydroxyisobutyrate dehydrogenase